MSEEELAGIDDLELEPLTDHELESSSGGNADGTNTCPTTSGCSTTVGCPYVEVE